MSNEIKELDTQIAALVAATPEFRQKSGLLTSVIGVGPKTAAACLAYLPELGSLTKGRPLRLLVLRPMLRIQGR